MNMMKRNPLSLSLSRSRLPRTIITCTVVFFLCLATGLLSGTLFRTNQKPAEAASASITVTDNNQVVTEDQGTTTIQRTSTVTVKDTTATIGYKLSAKASSPDSTTTIPGATVTMYPTVAPTAPNTSTCTQVSPCTLPVDDGTGTTAPLEILSTGDNIATQAAGDTTEWTVTITLPGATAQGNYIVDIVYFEDPTLPPPGLADGSNMQDATAEICEQTPMGATVNLVDQRDGKYYRVRKMADGRCWMIDDLAYDLANASAPSYYPSAVLISGTTASVSDRAQYIQNNNVVGQGQIPNNGNPTPSYLYNWCAAMGDTSMNCATTVWYQQDQPATPRTGICPAPFRLPIGGAIPTTPGDGTNQVAAAATTTNEFAKLDIWLGGSGTNRGVANTYVNFTTDNIVNPQLFWLGVLGGNYYVGGSYYGGLGDQGGWGYWWSSMASSGTDAYMLLVRGASSNVSPVSGGYKLTGYAVRCIL